MLADHLPHHSRIGAVLRWPLKLVPGDRPRAIVAGPGSRLSWVPAAGPHGIWLGLYERSTLRAFAAAVSEQDVVWDVGAHAGLYSLVAARAGAEVVAFEPLPENIDWLTRHLELNGLLNSVQVQPRGLGSTSGHRNFQSDATGLEGHVERRGDGRVEVLAADDVQASRPSVLKIDVEGSELEVLTGAAATIRAARPLIFLETHDPISVDDCLKLLPGYRADRLERSRFRCWPDPSLVRGDIVSTPGAG